MLHETGQPVLVGTISIEKSEKLSRILKKMGVKHEVLNAKQHDREALIVAQAGRKGAAQPAGPTPTQVQAQGPCVIGASS